MSKAIPNHPVYLRHASGHASLANAKAMEMFQVNKNSIDPDGGKFLEIYQVIQLVFLMKPLKV